MRTVIKTLLLGLACLAATAATAGRCSPPTAPDDYKYHNIIDHTGADHLNVMVSNTETSPNKSYPLTGACPNPFAGVNPALYPTTGFTPPTPNLYVEVKVNNSVLTSGSITDAVVETCNQSNYQVCPNSAGSTIPVAEGAVPSTYVYRLGTENGSGTVTALTNNLLPPANIEPLNTMFTLNGQAFDVDRIRFIANRLWYQWKQDVVGNTGWFSKFGYQPTGTMSFEQFLDNVSQGRPMYGIVRVVVPVDRTSEDALFDPSQPVNGAEFSDSPDYNDGSSPDWSGVTPSRANEMWSYEGEWATAHSYASPSSSKADSKTIEVYGMLLIDYVDKDTYDADDFFDASQDYINNYASVAAHDASSSPGKNFILPRTSGRNIYIKNWDTLNINAVNDLQTFVQYTDTPSAGGDGRMDTLDIVRRKYMMAGSTSFLVSEISDAYVWEYWMRKAAGLPAGDTTRTNILADLTGASPQYDIFTQQFAASATRRTEFDNTEWPTFSEKDKFHAYFPNGYERGWMVAFDALDLENKDGGTVGSWWNQLASRIQVGGVWLGDDGAGNNKYPALGVPNTTDAITVDADGDGDTDVMPNFFLTGWEDFPALAFAGGVLDMHAHANISGMLYTPDSAEMEAKTDKPAVFQYVSGAILVGNGIFLEGKSGRHSMISISFNYNSFDRLRGGSPNVTIKTVSSLRELTGQ